MKVGIVGSRRRDDRQSVEDLVDLLDEDDIVVSGGCEGVDTWAEERARERGLDIDIYQPDFTGYNSYEDYCKVYYKRNRQIVKNSDIVYAFVAENRAGGTEKIIKHAKELNVDVVIMEEDEYEQKRIY